MMMSPVFMLLLLGFSIQLSQSMSREEKHKLRYARFTKMLFLQYCKGRCVCVCMRTNMAVFPSRNQVLEMFDHAYQNYMVRAKIICQLNIDVLPHGRETTTSEKTAPGSERVHAGKMNRSSPFSVLLKKCLDN